jgi:hypothetical protein
MDVLPFELRLSMATVCHDNSHGRTVFTLGRAEGCIAELVQAKAEPRESRLWVSSRVRCGVFPFMCAKDQRFQCDALPNAH